MRGIGTQKDRPVEELLEVIGNANETLGNGHYLTLLCATNDLEQWLDERGDYNPRNPQQYVAPCESSIEDLTNAYEKLGAEVKKLLDTEMTALNSPLSQFISTLPSGDPTGYGADAKSKLLVLMAKAKSEDVLIAAWQDVVEGCRDISLRSEDLELRRDNLWRFAKALGYNLSHLGLGHELTGIIDDRAFEIATAQAELGERDYPTPAEIDPRVEAGMSIDDRLNLCERILRLMPPKADNIIWLYIMNATLSGVKVEAGNSVTFYSMEWVRPNVLGDNPRKDQLPPELFDGDKPTLSKYEFPEESRTRKFVLARVDLGNGFTSTAPSLASSVVSAMLALAGRINSDAWKLLDGFVHYTDGKLHTTSGVYVPEPMPLLPVHDYTAFMVNELKPEFSTLSAAGAGSLLDKTVEARKWLSDAATLEPLSKIIISVRVLELIHRWTTSDRLSWHKYWRDLLKDIWCQEIISERLFELCNRALHDLHSPLIDAERQEIKDMAKDILEPSGGLMVQYHGDAALLKLDRLADIYKNFPIVRGLKEQSAYFKSGQDLADEWNQRSEQFDMLMNRLVRYRNSAQHGGPLDEEVAATSDNFAHFISSLAVRNTLRALLDGNAPDAAQVTNKNNAHQHLVDLEGGNSPALLFS